MSIALNSKGQRYILPLVRYGIDNKSKTAHIFSVQTKRAYNHNHKQIVAVDEVIKGVNTGAKTDRNVTPHMLCALTVFLGMLKAQNISKITADSFLTRRYLTLYGIETEEEANEIYLNAVDKFFRMFRRLETQFDGIKITNFPLDVDSNMHIQLGDKVLSKNKTLQALFDTGLNWNSTLSNNLAPIVELE